MIHAEVAHHSAEGATVGPSLMNELRLASHAKVVRRSPFRVRLKYD